MSTNNQNQFDVNTLNSLIDTANNVLACDTECQNSQSLKTTYLNAKNNLALAEPEYQVAKKNYYVYVDGQSGYNQRMENELNQQASKFVTNFQSSYNKELEKIRVQIMSYDGLLINFRNIVDLYKQYKRENVKLFKDLKENTNDILTNDRKTFYEDQQIDTLNVYYYYFILIIYIAVVICLLVFSLRYHTNYSLKSRGIIFVFFVILPFISTFLLGKIIQFVYFLYSLLPKNVYN